jgi:hypothetical protein
MVISIFKFLESKLEDKDSASNAHSNNVQLNTVYVKYVSCFFWKWLDCISGSRIQRGNSHSTDVQTYLPIAFPPQILEVTNQHILWEQHFFIWKPKSKGLCQRNYRTYTNGILPTNSATVSNLVVAGHKFLRWHATLLFAVDTCFVVPICGLGSEGRSGVGADMARTNARSHQTRTACSVKRIDTTAQCSVSSFISSCRLVCGKIVAVFGDTGDNVGKMWRK